MLQKSCIHQLIGGSLSRYLQGPTVDGRNPAPPGMYKTLQTMGYLPYQLVQDFVHQQYDHPKRWLALGFRNPSRFAPTGRPSVAMLLNTTRQQLEPWSEPIITGIYPPGTGRNHIPPFTGSWENHRLKFVPTGIRGYCISSLECFWVPA